MAIEILCIRVVEALFFTGLAGCAFVVVYSWISIFESGSSSKDDIGNLDETALLQPTPDRSFQPNS